MQRYDFAEPAPARSDGRERPWRATDGRTRVDLDTSTPAGAAAAAAVALAFFDRSRAMGEAFMATEREEPDEWQDVAFLSNADLWLTAEETRKVTAALAAVLEPYRGRVHRRPPRRLSSRPGHEHGRSPPKALTAKANR